MALRHDDANNVTDTPLFRLYLQTKLANPHYTPEISTKATIVNFCVKQQGLEDQLLGTVVRKERPELETQKNDLVLAVAAGKRKLVELEDTILRLLSKAEGSLLDNEDLVQTLQSSKTTSLEVTQQLVVSEQTEKKIDAIQAKLHEAQIPDSTTGCNTERQTPPVCDRRRVDQVQEL